MKICVNYFGVCYVIPCGNGEETISWLIEETLKRKIDISDNDSEEDGLNIIIPEKKQLFLRHSKNYGLLINSDKIKEVLDDGDLVHLSKIYLFCVLQYVPPDCQSDFDLIYE